MRFVRAFVRALGRFLKLAFWPFAQAAVNVIGLLGVTLAAVWTWVRAHELAAGLGAVLIVALAVVVAGIRLQMRLDQLRSNRGVRERLGIALQMGGWLFSGITLSALARHKGETLGPHKTSQEEFKEWEEEVVKSLRRLGWDYAARFQNESGLPAIPGPDAPWYSDEERRLWEQIHHRRIRLAEIIKELPRE